MKKPSVQFPCCEHCIGEACPRLSGHNLPCGIKGCFSDQPIMEQTATPLSHAMEDIMGWREEVNTRQLREDLIDHATSVLGREPAGIRNLLRLLSSPQLVGETRRLFDRLDKDSLHCLNYEAPWNCATESEARSQTVGYGWNPSIRWTVNDSWCENCLSKVMGRPSIEEDDCGEE